jgi:hypothetical protein
VYAIITRVARRIFPAAVIRWVMVQVDRSGEIAYYAGQGAVPKWLRGRSAKPLLGGSNPPRASMIPAISDSSGQQSATTRMATGMSPVAIAFQMTDSFEKSVGALRWGHQCPRKAANWRLIARARQWTIVRRLW